jgi:hypothetical protein
MNVRRLTASLLRLKSDHRTGLTCLLEGVLADTECSLWSKADMALSNERADIAWEQRQARLEIE